MATTIWTRRPSQWHGGKGRWTTLPHGLRGQRLRLEELSRRDRTIFANILKRNPGHVVVRLAGGIRAVPRSMILEGTYMTDPTDLEKAAFTAALAPLGEYVGSIGMQRPLADYSKEEVLTLIEVAVTAYQNHMANINDEIPF